MVRSESPQRRTVIFIIGSNFRQTTLSRVARVQWAEKSNIGAFLEEICERFLIPEAFFLQTCNRREFYFFAPEHHAEKFKAAFLEALSDSLGCNLDDEDFYLKQHRDAVLHLFRVASSLDSMVLGETEIMKQIRDQSEMATNRGCIGPRLKALVKTALEVGRQVRHRTRITRNVVSMGSLAMRRTMEFLTGRARRRVVFVGAGHFIESILPTFAKAGSLELLFVNRTCPEALAAAYGGQAMSLSAFLHNPGEFDVLISATSAPGTLFNAEWVAERGSRMLLIDAALPGDIDPQSACLPDVSYMGLQEMEQILEKNKAAREAEIPKTIPIFEEGWQRLEARLLECELSPYNREISDHYRQTGQKALDFLLKDQFAHLSASEAEHLREWTHDLVNRLTNIPILGLKGVARDMGRDAIDAYTRNVAEKSRLFKQDRY